MAVISDFENVHFPDPDYADEPSDFRAWLALAILTLGTALFAAYFTLPSLTRQWLCPAQTFLHGSTTGGAEIFLSLLLLPASFALIVCTRFDGHYRMAVSEKILRNERASVALGVGAFVLNALAIANMSLSYYCVTPTQITVSSGIEQRETLSWDDVSSVEVLCWISTASGRTGWGHPSSDGLILGFSDGKHIQIRPGTGPGGMLSLARDYRVIHAALAGHAYRFEISHPNLCPRQYYVFFKRWQG